MSVDYVTSGYDVAGNQITSFFSYNNGDPTLLKSVYTGAVAAAAKPTAAVIKRTEEDAVEGFIIGNPDASYDELYAGAKAYTDILSGKEIDDLLEKHGKTKAGQFITKDWFISTYGKDTLIKAARTSGYATWYLTKTQEMNRYLDDMMKRAEAGRERGQTDEEIIKDLMK